MVPLLLVVAALAQASAQGPPTSLNIGYGYNILKNIVHPVFGSDPSSPSLTMSTWPIFDVTETSYTTHCPTATTIMSTQTASTSTFDSVSNSVTEGISVSVAIPIPPARRLSQEEGVISLKEAGERRGEEKKGIELTGSMSAEFGSTVKNIVTYDATFTQTTGTYIWAGYTIKQGVVSPTFKKDLLSAMPASEMSLITSDTEAADYAICYDHKLAHFIEQYGTHVIVGAKGGSKFGHVATSVSTSSTYEDVESQSTGVKVGIPGLEVGYDEKTGSDTTHKQAASQSGNNCYNYGSASNPQPIKYQLTPLHQVIGEIGEEVSGDKASAARMKVLKSALARYIANYLVPDPTTISEKGLSPMPLLVWQAHFYANTDNSDTIPAEFASMPTATLAAGSDGEKKCLYWTYYEKGCPHGYARFGTPRREGEVTTSQDFDGQEIEGCNANKGTTEDKFENTCVKTQCLATSSNAWVQINNLEQTKTIYMVYSGTTFVKGWIEGDQLALYQHTQFPDMLQPCWSEQMIASLGLASDVCTSGYVLSQTCMTSSDDEWQTQSQATYDLQMTTIEEDASPVPQMGTKGDGSTMPLCSAPSNMQTCSSTGAGPQASTLHVAIVMCSLLLAYSMLNQAE